MLFKRIMGMPVAVAGLCARAGAAYRSWDARRVDAIIRRFA
jgi:hypothetical protein